MPPARPGTATANLLVVTPAEQRIVASVAVASAQFANAPLPPPRPGPRPVAVASLGALPILPSSSPAAIPAPAAAGKDSAKPASQNSQPRLAVSDNAKVAVVVSKTKAGAAVPAGALANSSSSPAMGFSSKPAGDLATNRFTGPAVKPLAVVR